MVHHGGALRGLVRDDRLIDDLVTDFRSASLTDQERAILEYAEKLTERPAEMTADDVAALRRVGLDDAQVLDVAQVTAYFNFVNRLVEGLGVELENGGVEAGGGTAGHSSAGTAGV